MNEMVERVAKALWDTYHTDSRMGPPPEPNEPYRRLARAAITAMREPTEEMLLFAVRAHRTCSGDNLACIKVALKAYFDAALEPVDEEEKP